MTFHVPEQYRVRIGRLASTCAHGNNGAFFIRKPDRKGSMPLQVIASDELGWLHVSVSTPTRCPTWEEMCFIKGLFWDDDDCVMQLHPPKQDWISNHSFCLHLWQPIDADIPRPPDYMVGIKELGVLA